MQSQVAQRIDALKDKREQSNLSAISGVLAGLSLDKEIIQRILRRELMKESVIYQEWQAESEQRGRQKEGRALILRQLDQKFGTLPESIVSQISALTLEQVEALAIALLNFTTIADLETWLETNG